MTHVPKTSPTPRPLPLRLLRFLVVTLLWAVPFAIFFAVLNGGGWWTLWLCYRISLVFTLTIRISLWLAGCLLVPRLSRPGVEPHWLLDGVVYTLTAIAATYVASGIVQRFVWPTFMHGRTSWVVSGMFALLFSTLFAGILYAREFYRQAAERGAQVERIRAELARSELRALRAQVNPHFLFNTLNAIASLIAENPRAAEDLTTRLADVFRYALTSDRREHVRFGDELEFLRNCLAIEHVRFGDRLRVVEDVAAGLDEVPVPGLLFQPLLENAVAYAVAPRAEGGTIRLEAAAADGRLRVTIADDGPGFDPAAPPRGNGVGLAGVRERLRLAGPGHALDVATAPGGGTRVTVTLPLAPLPAAGTTLPEVRS